jgi:CheY-like chemotaxis protein
MSTDHAAHTACASLVRSALAHLYDYAYLQNHPLAALVDAERALDGVSRAQALRRLLLDCVEEIKPQAGGDLGEADRVHAILVYRYVDGLPMDRVAAKRGLGIRQAYRALREGIGAVTRLLQDRIGLRDAESASDLGSQAVWEDRVQLAQAEIARLQRRISTESLEVRDILQSILGLLEPLSLRTGISIVLSDSGPWPTVVADRVMLRQVLLNLCMYAMKYLVNGNLYVSATAGPRQARIDLCESAEVVRKIPIAASPPADADVGLEVARGLVEAQGGQLTTLRQHDSWQACILLPTSEMETILVIDDNVDLVSLWQRYLAGHRVRVVGATSAEVGLRMAIELQPRVITLDIMMPNQDGWEALQRLKSSSATRHIPIIVCSVLNEAQLAEATGASGYLTKPIAQADLLKMLTRWLGPLPPAA